MAELTQEQKDFFKKLAEENDLTKDHFYTARTKDRKVKYVIITRSGIEIIARKNEIKVFYDPVTVQPDFACIRGTFTDKEGREIMTFGSASMKTCQSAYYAEMAEKRCLARGVLQIMKAYEVGVRGEDEFSSEEIQKD